MSNKYEKLFQSGNIGTLELNNRIVKAPTWSLLGARDGSVTERMIRFYAEIARGGTGLVIVEITFVDNKSSKSGACEIGVADGEYLPGLSLLAQAIQAGGARAALQISHAGRQRSIGAPIKAASRIPLEGSLQRGWPVPEELTFEEIQEIVTAFGTAARRGQIAGFDMVEIHGCHGYLINNFLSPRTNKRTDAYGGSAENRMRFLLEIVKDVRAKVGPDYPLSVRLNGTDYEPDGVMIEDTIEVAVALEKLAVDAIHLGGGNHHQRLQRMSPMSMPPGLMLWAAEAVKKVVSIPVIANGAIITPELAEETLSKGKADFISLARPLFADPYWPRKAKEERPEDIVPCIRCNEGCFYRSMGQHKAILCTVNAALGKEAEFSITPAKVRKKVAVIGGGPAGMEAARVCALRGHNVTLYEKRQLGGALIEASVPEFKSDLRRLIKYFDTQIKKLKIKAVMEEANLNTIRSGDYDVAIVAVGGMPIKLDVPGGNKPSVIGALEVLNGKITLGSKMTVVGAGMIGSEVGLFLAEQGKEITFVEILDEFMNGVGLLDKIAYQERFAQQKVTVHTGKRVESIIDGRVVIVDRYGQRDEIISDNIVVAIGFCPQMTLAEELKKEEGLEVYAVGDCVCPRKVFDAIHEGFVTAHSLA